MDKEIKACLKRDDGEALIKVLAELRARPGHDELAFPPPLILMAAEEGKSACLLALIEMGADLEVQGLHKATPLLRAAARGRAECMRLLLSAGAKVDARDQYKNTLLLWAVDGENAECVRLAADAGVDLCAENDSGTTATEHATRKGFRDCVAALDEARQAKERDAQMDASWKQSFKLF